MTSTAAQPLKGTGAAALPVHPVHGGLMHILPVPVGHEVRGHEEVRATLVAPFGPRFER